MDAKGFKSVSAKQSLSSHSLSLYFVSSNPQHAGKQLQSKRNLFKINGEQQSPKRVAVPSRSFMQGCAAVDLDAL